MAKFQSRTAQSKSRLPHATREIQIAEIPSCAMIVAQPSGRGRTTMDGELIEPFAVQEVFVDGWGERTLSEGIYSSVGYRIIKGEKVAVVRILQRASAVRIAAREAERVLDGNQPPPNNLVLLKKV